VADGMPVFLSERCPLCGGRLLAHEDGPIVCSLVGCPDPFHVHKLLHDAQMERHRPASTSKPNSREDR
jgi:uncharacterized Zn finger protein (UPF0148 family)